MAGRIQFIRGKYIPSGESRPVLTQSPVILSVEGATVCFTKADFEELRINLHKIRFGPRAYRPPPIRLSILPQVESSNHRATCATR